MEPAAALSGFRCVDCEGTVPPSRDARACPNCDGSLLADYEYPAVRPTPDGTSTDGFLEATGLAPLLGLDSDAVPGLGQGETPLLDAPSVAADLDVGTVAIKDEGRNPTGGLVDREVAPGIGAARAAGADAVALPTTGGAGRAAAAAAARVGLESHAFVPSRTPFVTKAIINVHGGDMTVTEGRYRDAATAYREAMADEAWYPLAPFATPWRVDGAKPVAYEIAADRGWAAPEWLVLPTGQVTSLVGITRGFRDLEALGLIDRVPRIVAAQAAGCAPLAAARRRGRDEPVPVEHPDTVVGALEIADPSGGTLALQAIAGSGGAAVAVPDADILSAAGSLAEAGFSAGATGGAAFAAARRLSDRLGPDEDVVLVNPVAGSLEADLLRSHLMSQGR